jgi:hypothetical protein
MFLNLIHNPYKLSKFIFCLLAFQFVILSLSANHIVGAFLEYDCVEPGVYEVTLNVFQDCFDDLVTEDVNIRVVPDCDLNFFAINLPLLSNEDITDVCPSQVSNTLCQEGLLASYRLVRYRGLVNVTTNCESFRFMWKINYRGDADNITDENWVFYTHTIVYPGNAPCNNSPKSNAPRVPVNCLNGPGSIDMNVTESDGDSIHFNLTTLLHSPGGITFAPMTYADGFDSMNPMPGAVLNETTGRFDYSTESQGRYFIVIEVDEYNELGSILSKMNIDFLIVNVTCADSGLGAGSDQLSGLTEGVQSNGPLSIEVCQNQTFCGELVYPIGTEDLNIEVQHDLQEILDNVEVSIEMGSDSVRLRFCGTSGNASESAQVQFLLTDDHCPYTNEVLTEIEITISEASAPDVFIEFFGGELSLTNPEAGQTYQWYQDNTAVPGAVASTLQTLEDGSNYYLAVTSATGCTSISNVINFETVGLAEIEGLEFQIAPNPTNGLLRIDSKLLKNTITRGEVRNQLGQLKMEFVLDGTDNLIEVQDLSHGIYQLSLIIDGQSLGSRTFIKL